MYKMVTAQWSAGEKLSGLSQSRPCLRQTSKHGNNLANCSHQASSDSSALVRLPGGGPGGGPGGPARKAASMSIRWVTWLT